MFDSFLTALTFMTIIPAKNSLNLKYFCPSLPLVGVLLSFFWWAGLSIITSSNLSGLIMTTATLALTGGLHLDGLMDTCDAVLSHRDRQTRLKIMSDPHVGSFAVMGCVVILLAKTFAFPLLPKTACIIPIYSRLGAGILLNNLPFAKEGGLAKMFGEARRPANNFVFAIIIMIVLMIEPVIFGTFILYLIFHAAFCLKIFGGITGDLLGAFVEISEALMMAVMACS